MKRREVRAGGRRAPAFTLVELLVVIIIIGILAAVAIPQFGDTSATAKVAALDQDLSCVRAALEVYYQQHGKYAGIIATHKAGASATAAQASAADAFVKQLTCYSNANGDTTDTKDATNFPYGPYLRKGIPDNPLPATTATGAPATVNVTADTGPLAADNAPATGWKASSQTGEFIANNSAYSSR